MTLHALDYSSNQGNSAYSPPTHSPPKRVSEAEYWETYYDYPEKTYEWNNGYLEEKAVSDYLTISIADWFSELLGHFLKTYPIAKKTWLEMGFSLSLAHKSEIRRPDLGIVLDSNPVPLLPEDRSYGGTYDLCIEVLSDSSKADIARDTVSKKAEYAAGGVKEYYILDGHDRHTAFYHLNAKGVYVPIKPFQGDIIKSTVLPGFQFRTQDLYQRPSPEEMIDDSVYQGFVLPGYSEAKQQAEEATLQVEKVTLQVEKATLQVEKVTQRADKERRARQEAEQRAERFAEQLRALGINPDDILTK